MRLTYEWVRIADIVRILIAVINAVSVMLPFDYSVIT
jgi:hypothetical protein